MESCLKVNGIDTQAKIVINKFERGTITDELIKCTTANISIEIVTNSHGVDFLDNRYIELNIYDTRYHLNIFENFITTSKNLHVKIVDNILYINCSFPLVKEVYCKDSLGHEIKIINSI